MGQGASTPRDLQDPRARHSWRRVSQIHSNRDESDHEELEATTRDQVDSHAAMPDPALPALNSRPSRPFATFSRHISARSTPVQRGASLNHPGVSTRDEIFYEEREERPLVHLEELGMLNAPITHITASPMPRRSRLSRIGSLVLPGYTAGGSTAGDDGTYAQGRPMWWRRANRTPSSIPPEDHAYRGRPSFVTGLFSNAPNLFSRSRHQRLLAPISRPYSLNAEPADSVVPQDREAMLHNGPLRNHLANTSGFTDAPSTTHPSRIRRSSSGSVDLLNPSFSERSTVSDGIILPSPHESSRLASSDNLHFLLPPLGGSNPMINLSGAVPDSTDPLVRDRRSSTTSTMSEPSERIAAHAGSLTWAERWTERGSASRREGRRLPSMFRGRSHRLVRRDHEGPLPRILTLAATAIAAQLSGAPEQHATDIQPVGADDLDGSLNNLFRTLQSATNMTGNTSSPRINNSDRATIAHPPLNFLRVFRFISQTTEPAFSHEAASGRHDGRFGNAGQSSPNTTMDESDGRMVTLVVVGVRSVPSEYAGHGVGSIPEPNLNSLMDVPQSLTTAGVLRNGAAGLLRQADGRSILPHRRRASIGGHDTISTAIDSQGRHRSSRSSLSNTNITQVHGTSISPALLDTPAGPHPPPSTPADPALSNYTSPNTASIRRPSSASAIQSTTVDSRAPANIDRRDAGIPDLITEENHFVQHRRRSDSEFARHRDLGAGAARRNGVVEPDNVETGDAATPGSRSWLIYVVGTNLSEDHPALTTPSLFTDDPTYEDMILLSSLLGPAKPPVASREDVALAEGIYRVHAATNTLVAAAVQGTDQIQIGLNEHCLVCLEQYQGEDELRRLGKCSHIFHRQCIDEWLTTGRNSCPLCRGQGVDEKKGVRAGHPDSSDAGASMII